MAGIRRTSVATGICPILALLTASCERPVPSRPLTEISAVRQLSRAQAARGYPVSLVGSVTFIDLPGRLVVIEERGAAVRIDMGIPVPTFRLGNRVSVSGITASGSLVPEVLAASLKVLDSQGQLPTPQPLSESGIRSGALEYRRVAVFGVQRSRQLNRSGRVVIEVETPAGVLHATSFDSAQDFAPRWVGHRLRFPGILHTGRDAPGGALRTEIFVERWQQVELDEPAAPDTARPSGLQLLQTVAAIRALAPTEPIKGYPVSLRGVATGTSLVGPFFFMQDSTGGIYVRGLPAGMAPVPGDRVELQGHTVEGNFLTDVVIERLRIAGHGPMPEPAKANLIDVLDGRHRAEWVAVEGYVQSVGPGPGALPALSLAGVSVELLAGSAHIPVRLAYPAAAPLPVNLVAARVRLRGVCASRYNQRQQFLGIRLDVPGPEFVTVLDPARAIPPPVRPVAWLLRGLSGAAPDTPVRVRGVVTLPPVSDFGGFYLQDDTGGVFVRSIPDAPLETGDEAEATGFAELGGVLPVMEATGYRKVSRTKEIAPEAVLPEEAMRGDYDSQLIRIRGTLTNHVSGPRHEVFTLSQGDVVFLASLDGVTAPPAGDAFRTGSLLEFTGVCAVEADRDGFPVSFRILLRSPRDVVVVQQAPWWNRDRALIALGFAAFAALAVFAWVLLLRKRVREQTADIALEKERYRSLVDHAPDIVFGSDIEGNLEFVNPAAERLLGYTQDELVGRNMRDLLPAAQRQAALEAWWRLISGEAAGPRICEIEVKSGGTIAVEINAGVVRKGLRPVAIHGILRDVTERLRLEEQLRQSQKMEAIGRLAGGVAHDFNNLLTVIMGNAMMLQENMRVHGLGEFDEMEAVIQASETAADLTRQLLSYSGKAQVLVEPIDLSECIGGLGTLLRAAVPKSVEVRLELAPDLPAVESDRGQMKQIVSNLVLNAAEAIGGGVRGVVRVTTRLRRLTGYDVTDSITGASMPAGDYVAIEVADTGCGMDAATASRIFDPFFSTKFTGRGLGLPAVAGTVKAHRGGIELETAPGSGSRFCVLLPASALRPIRVAPAAGRLPGSGTVLVVDDEDPVRGLAIKALSKIGYGVLSASNGSEAIRVFEEFADRIDAVLLDMSMPVLGGKQTLAAIRARRPSVPTVLMSGYTEEQTLGDFVRGPQLAFLHKPFTIAELAEAVRSVMHAPAGDAPPN